MAVQGKFMSDKCEMFISPRQTLDGGVASPKSIHFILQKIMRCLQIIRKENLQGI